MKSNFLFIGGHAGLDFVNTEKISVGKRVDTLQTASDLFAWLHEVGLWNAQQSCEAEAWAFANEESAAELVQSARAFRGVLRNMAERAAKTGARPGDAPMNAVNAHLQNAVNALLQRRAGYEQVARQKSGDFVRVFVPLGKVSVSDDVLATLAQTARDLLCFADVSLIKQCDGHGCILLFLDTTKNHTRCWCSMAGCGNRAKAAAHYQRVRAAKKA